eukprot:GGOE01043815.1.p5 GENE.GGOE01043815.1~~GGOE01043815.1.p5  ORF type:complete len:113 (+),score=26.44 GGOE01043815.1:415-753(+)
MDYGMPSSHCQFMFYLLAHASILLLVSGNPRRWLAIFSLALLSLAVAYSRVHLEYHTWGQVVVGGVVGSAVGLLGGQLAQFLAKRFRAEWTAAVCALDWALGVDRLPEDRRR